LLGMQARLKELNSLKLVSTKRLKTLSIFSYMEETHGKEKPSVLSSLPSTS
jgi:hypothetical protein